MTRELKYQTIQFAKDCIYPYYYYEDNQFMPTERNRTFSKGDIFDVQIFEDEGNIVDVQFEEGMIFGIKKEDFTITPLNDA